MNWTRTAGMTAAEIDAKRKELLSRCGFDSLTEVTRVDGFTKVLNELLVLQGTSLKAGIEREDQTINRARTIRHQIAAELVPCLYLYIEDVPGYLQTVMESKTRYHKIDRPTTALRIQDLDYNAVQQLQYTLAARLNTLRNKASDTICDMKCAAHIPCDCSRCKGSIHPMVPAIPPAHPAPSVEVPF
jgi:hypothetical protein